MKTLIHKHSKYTDNHASIYSLYILEKNMPQNRKWVRKLDLIKEMDHTYFSGAVPVYTEGNGKSATDFKSPL